MSAPLFQAGACALEGAGDCGDRVVEHLGGFYIIEAEDLDAALSWAAKTADCVNRPIEVRPFWEAPGA